jgi:hypothetical protein
MHKKTFGFLEWIFMKLTNAQLYYADLLCWIFLELGWNVECKDRNSFTSQSEEWLSLYWLSRCWQSVNTLLGTDRQTDTQTGRHTHTQRQTDRHVLYQIFFKWMLKNVCIVFRKQILHISTFPATQGIKLKQTQNIAQNVYSVPIPHFPMYCSSSSI